MFARLECAFHEIAAGESRCGDSDCVNTVVLQQFLDIAVSARGWKAFANLRQASGIHIVTTREATERVIFAGDVRVPMTQADYSDADRPFGIGHLFISSWAVVISVTTRVAVKVDYISGNTVLHHPGLDVQ